MAVRNCRDVACNVSTSNFPHSFSHIHFSHIHFFHIQFPTSIFSTFIFPHSFSHIQFATSIFPLPHFPLPHFLHPTFNAHPSRSKQIPKGHTMPLHISSECRAFKKNVTGWHYIKIVLDGAHKIWIIVVTFLIIKIY
ncbi:hypothetical protein MTBBW1_1620006 [Desulfamplus magnetovallimortis]|uniref:Uncharacterized protein n=1 Tax=Desulfamplus magnetovallimortis TaxID=1246637 RepID=A0A1W1H8X1_9BACT|nr:hypothetical protein MTBBW1_1620006 [Desulfamplus magnetovallimortis]